MSTDGRSAPVRRDYQYPPLIEALAEIFFTGSQWDDSLPERFHERIRERFPTSRRVNQLGFEFTVAAGQADARQLEGPPKWQFLNSDGSQMIQLSRDMLVINQLRPNQQVPYPRYEQWQPLVMEMLGLYREIGHPAAIERLGVRYINRVELPLQRFLMETYFNLYPQVPASLGAEHGPFMMSLQLVGLYEEHQLIVSFGNAPVERAGTQAYALDIYDIVPLGQPDSFQTLEGRLNEAHQNIVTTFEGAITGETRALFGEVTNGGS